MRHLRAALPYARIVLVVGLLACAAALLQAGVDRFSPVKGWLIWRLLAIWGYQLLFVAGCLSLGGLVCRRVLRDFDELPGLEATVLAMAVGVVGFVFAIYIVGAMRLLGPVAAILLPLAMIAAAARFSPLPGRFLGSLHRWRLRFTPAEVAILAFGVVGVGAVYLQILNPEALGHDAHWTHVVIAQDIAREGKLVDFPADWAKNFPHLASMVYAWSFMAPGLGFSMRMLMVMHAEFVLFLFTLAAVTAAVRWLVGGRTRHGLAWVGFFLFPNIVLYDSNLCASADHVAAFFILPMCLAVARGIERPERRGAWALGGLLMGAALTTKLQCAYLAMIVCGLAAVFAGGRIALGLLRKAGASSPRRHLVGPVTLAAWVLLGASPHLIERAVFYRNPVYPFAQDVFPQSTPTIPDAAALVDTAAIGVDQHCPTGATRWARVKKGLRLAFTFAFEPHYSFKGDRPSFGFLFTLLSPLVLVLPNTRRLKLGALACIGAVFAWAMTRQIDRNLQIVLPALVAVTVGTMARIWSLGRAARAALCLLVLLQVAWNAQYLYEPIQPLLERARLGALGRVDAYDLQARREMTRRLPEDAVVLMHYQHVTLGLDRRVLHDTGGFQGLIDQRPLHTARALYERWREIGITHVVWNWREHSASPQEQIAFAVFASLDAVRMGTFGENELAAMPPTAPPAERPYRTLVLGVSPYADGVYTVDQLSMFDGMPLPRPPDPQIARAQVPDLGDLASGIDVALFANEHPEAGALTAALARDFEELNSNEYRRLFVNRSLRQARQRR
ncbi:MAG: hypothetical protein JXP73_06775 [Deltaproteobacteria bacterium]|nr:hypothetical protein [Deltaproteobacteria bacterium]